MTRKKLGILALAISSLVLFILPSGSLGGETSLRGALQKTGQDLKSGLQGVTQQTNEATTALVEKTKRAADKAKTGAQKAKTRATASDPQRQPPLHGTNPHGQGTVGVVDGNPSSERPLGGATNGSNSGEEVVVGRARGEQNADGSFHGHITIAALFGNEIVGVDSTNGQANQGPLQPLQTALNSLCTNTQQQVCLSVLTANSTTNATGSTNDFAVARAKIFGLGVGAAESNGTIVQDANCQTSGGGSSAANVTSGGTVAAGAAKSTSTSKSCKGGAAPQVSNTSQVLQLGNAGIPLPAPGCANGTPDTVTGLPPLLPIVCNADEIAGAAGVREALDVYALSAGNGSLLKEATASSESLSVAPAETGTQCTDGIDNDGDGVIDTADPGCHTDGNANNPASFDPTDNDETNAGAGTGGSGGGDDNGGGGGNDGSGDGGGTQCSDGVDNDGDGVSDRADPGCHTDGNANNPNSYDPSDDSEADGGAGGGGGLDADQLPFTGADIIGMTLAGLLALAGGLLLRRREGLRTVR
jgi:hypothetical protein